MPDIGTILGQVSARETRVRVCVSGEAAAAVERAGALVRSTARGTAAAQKKARQALDEARAAVDAATFEFTFRQLPAKERSDLQAQHPSADGAWDEETFPPALVAASCVDPVMTPAQAAELMNGLTEADRASLFNAAWQVNTAPNPTVTVSA